MSKNIDMSPEKRKYIALIITLLCFAYASLLLVKEGGTFTIHTQIQQPSSPASRNGTLAGQGDYRRLPRLMNSSSLTPVHKKIGAEPEIRTIDFIHHPAPYPRSPRNKKMSKDASQKTNTSTDTSADRRETDDDTFQFVTYHTGDTIQLRCQIPNGPYLVIWNKIGLDYPITVGRQRFTPDVRFSVQFEGPDKWQLTLINARLNDSGVYTCRTSSQSTGHKTTSTTLHGRDVPKALPFNQKVAKDARLDGIISAERSDQIHQSDEKNHHSRSKNLSDRGAINSDYYITVVEPTSSERYQVDVPVNKIPIRTLKSISVTGPKLVFYGTPLELICRATFPTAEAKMNPQIILEWYHRGFRRRPSVSSSSIAKTHPRAGVYITQQWIDSHLLESRLLVTWASEKEAGQWVCLERTNLDMLSTTTALSKLDKYPVNIVPSTAAYTFGSRSPVPDRLKKNSNHDDVAFDRIEVDIIVPTLSVTEKHRLHQSSTIHYYGKKTAKHTNRHDQLTVPSVSSQPSRTGRRTHSLQNGVPSPEYVAHIPALFIHSLLILELVLA